MRPERAGDGIKLELGQQFDTVRRWCLDGSETKALVPVRPIATKELSRTRPSICARATTGWYGLVKQGLHRDPLSGDLFLFSSNPDAQLALAWIAQLYAIDERAGPDAESKALLQKSEPTAVLAELKAWLWSQAVLKTLSIGKAAEYTIAN